MCNLHQMSAELTITISSVEENPDSTYKRMSRKRYRVKQPAIPISEQAAEIIRQTSDNVSTVVKETVTKDDAPVLTRGGRVVKKPQRYEPVETVTDDFPESEHDTDYDSEA